MKIAISGKGGVGKSTLAAALSLLLARRGDRVLAVDADPDANLAASIGVPSEVESTIVPISEQRTLVEERTGAKVKQYGQMFKINPKVDDIAGEYALKHNGVDLIVLGAVEQGGGGCACPESVLIRALVTDMVLFKNESLIMDMEAGVEHLGRATARGVDYMIVVLEPGQRSVSCANRVFRMVAEIGMENILLVGNKIRSDKEEQFLRDALPGRTFLGMIPWHEAFRETDRLGRSVLESLPKELEDVFVDILQKLEERVPS